MNKRRSTIEERASRRHRNIAIFLGGIMTTAVLVGAFWLGGRNALLRAEGDCDALGATKLWVQPYTCTRFKK